MSKSAGLITPDHYGRVRTMPQQFKRFISDQIQCIVRDIGQECIGDRAAENSRVMEWIEKNAVRFRDEWYGEDGRPETQAN